MKKVLLGVLLAVFLVGLMGVSAQAADTRKIKEVFIQGYGGVFVTVEYPNYKELKEFSAAGESLIYLTLCRSRSGRIPDGLAFIVEGFERGKDYRDHSEKSSMFCPVRVTLLDDGRIKIEGYINIAPTSLAEALLIVDAMEGNRPLYLRIWWKSGPKSTTCKQVELD